MRRRSRSLTLEFVWPSILLLILLSSFRSPPRSTKKTSLPRHRSSCTQRLAVAVDHTHIRTPAAKAQSRRLNVGHERRNA